MYNFTPRPKTCRDTLNHFKMCYLAFIALSKKAQELSGELTLVADPKFLTFNFLRTQFVVQSSRLCFEARSGSGFHFLLNFSPG